MDFRANAKKLFDQAEKNFEEGKDFFDGESFEWAIRDYKQAINLYLDHRAELSAEDYDELDVWYNNLAVAYHHMQDYENEIAVLTAAIAAVDRSSYFFPERKHIEAGYLKGIGQAYEMLDNQQAALECYNNAYDIYVHEIDEGKTEYRRQAAQCKSLAAAIYESNNQTFLAESAYQMAIKCLELIKPEKRQDQDFRGMAYANFMLGYAAQTAGEMNSALQYFQKSLQWLNMLKDKHDLDHFNQSLYYQQLGLAYAECGADHYNDALQQFAQASVCLKAISKDSRDENYRARLSALHADNDDLVRKMSDNQMTVLADKNSNSFAVVFGRHSMFSDRSGANHMISLQEAGRHFKRRNI